MSSCFESDVLERVCEVRMVSPSFDHSPEEIGPESVEPSAGPPLPERLRAAESRLHRRATYDLQPPAMERAFLAALQGDDVGVAGPYQVYSSIDPQRTVVLLHDPTGRHGLLKYIVAETADRLFFVAAPLKWTEYHRQILDRVGAALGSEVQCRGGGFLHIIRSGEMFFDGESAEFGPADHARAEAAFRAAINRSTDD